MDVVDPKDMTASELLRWAANGEPYSNGLDDHTWNNPTGKIKALAEAVTGEWPVDLEAFSHIADKIDAELAQARELSLLQGAAIWAKANGWPDFRDGEDFGAWLDRCAVPRPRFEDGEPVDVSEYEDILGYSVLDDGGFALITAGGSIEYEAGERVERPAPEAMGADGLPVKVGDKVWSTVSGNEGIVIALNVNGESTAHVEWGDGRWSPDVRCDRLTHTPPDTQERIDDDATMPPAEYCAARGIDLGDDPDRETATAAMVRDLLRRQRELDARKGGAE